MPFRPIRYRVALFIALVGLAFAIFTEVVHQQMGTGSALGQLCDLGGVVKCDTVIGSRWGKFLGLPVAVWGAGAFAVGAALAVPGALGAGSPWLADAGLVALGSWSLGFALVLATVMLGVIGNVCVFCLTMDAIIVSWFVTVVPLARRIERGNLLAMGAVALAVATGTFAATRSPATASTVDEIRALDPGFFDMYGKLPVRSATDVLGDARHAKGAAGATITVVEYSDFECPACGAAFASLRTFLHDHPDVRFVFRHFPLDPACNPMVKQRLHPDACLAAAASECAGAQDKFWPYHDQLFTHQVELDRDSLFRYAREVGLDIPRFRSCLDDPATMARIQDDVAAGDRNEIHSTPTFFINGRQVDGMPEPPRLDWALMIERQSLAPH